MKINPKDVVDSYNTLQVQRKLILIMKSKSITIIPLNIGDIIEVYQQKEKEKLGTWSQPKTILNIDHNARSITVHGKLNKTLCVAVE